MTDLLVLEGGPRLLVVLHGHGDDPAALPARRPDLDPEARWTVVAPRGPVTLADGAPAWFDDGGAHDADRLRAALADALADAAEVTGLDADGAVALGWSQGAAAALTLVAAAGFPRVSAVAAVAGWLPELEGVAWAPDPAATVLAVHGADDDVVPRVAGRSAAKVLARAGAAVRWQEHEAGHELSGPMLADVAGWLADVAAGARPSDPA